jgi:hypothetical protein
MKKRWLLILFTGLVALSGHAQGKQRRMLLEQIAGLKVYIDYAQKGYSIAKKGLTVIGDFKKGEFNLHTDYLNSLTMVNPAIKKYSRLAEIIVLQLKIIENYKQTYGDLKDGDLFHGSELAYVKRVFDRLLDNCSTTMEELIAVTTNDQLEMKDDERIQRIDMLYLTMVDSYSFCQSFNKQTKLLLLSRVKDVKEVQFARVLNGIND